MVITLAVNKIES